ncbi:hypothetical protein HN51_037970 [Arachis hypogaea]
MEHYRVYRCRTNWTELLEIEKPPIPNASPSSKPNQKRKIPSPKELISHYESQGMNRGSGVICYMKLDSKPCYVETVAIGVASAATLRGMGAIIAPLAQIWNSVTTATKSTPQ